MQFDLGKIKFKWKGAYDPSLTYEADDVVFYGNSSYIALANIEANQEPPNEGWDLMAKGDEAKPFLRMGSYGGWVGQDIYPDNTWNALQCFENIVENRGDFIINSNVRVTLPKDGIYHLHCSAYAHSCQYHHTKIMVNGSEIVQGGSTITYWDGSGDGYFQHEWHDVVHLKANDYVEFWFFPKNSVNDDHMIYHGHMRGSIAYLGV